MMATEPMEEHGKKNAGVLNVSRAKAAAQDE
jgi:hypothetical protein